MRLASIIVMILCCASVALAQETGPFATVGGGLSHTTEIGGGGASLPSGDSGQSATLSAGGGYRIDKTWSVVGEISLPLSALHTVHRYSGFRCCGTIDRDQSIIFLSGVVRANVLKQVAAIGGVGLSRNSVQETDVFRQLAPTPPAPVTTYNEFVVTSFALVFGGDALFPLARHVALGPSFRLFLYKATPEQDYRGRFGSKTYQVAVAVEIH
jgi:hypothetical protein